RASVLGRWHVQVVVDAGGEVGADAGHLGDLLGGGSLEVASGSEVFDEGGPAGGTDTWQRVEDTLGHALAAPPPLVPKGEAVRLVADPLEQVERLGSTRD